MKLSEFRCEATRVFSELKKGSTFLTVHHYLNNFGEMSDFSIVFHIDYVTAVKRSASLLEKYIPCDEDVIGKPYTKHELTVAKTELLDSFSATLSGYNPKAWSANAYSRIDNGEGSPVSGVKLHDVQDILHLTGFRVHKNILLKGNYPEDKRAIKTIAKDDLRAKCPVGRYVQFKLTPGKFRKLVVSGLTVLEKDVVRISMENLSIDKPYKVQDA